MDTPAHILEKLAATSQGPGVYLMKNEAGNILYVGKAANLKRRVSSYFARPANRDPKTDVLVSKIAIFETILTATAHEALVLESNLIKRHKPRYNVVLKDGKLYPSLRIDQNQPYPCLEIVRKVKKDGARYFGPFTSAGAARETLKIIHKTFRIRRCKKPELPRRTRPCINFQMGNCLGPCCLLVDPDQYQEMIQEAILFLKGKTPSLLKKYQEKMLLASEGEEFERAAEFRDKMFAIKKTVERQVAVTTDFEDRDVAALVARPAGCMVTMLHVRGGFLVGSRNYPFLEAVSQDRNLLQDFLLQVYEKDAFVPPEILVSEPLEDAAFVEDRLGDARGGRVRILVPQRGEKVRLTDMARQNAVDALERRLSGEEYQKEALAKVGRRLRLTGPPGRLECFDVSHTQGSQTVASQVVFSDGAPDKDSYRRYKVRDVMSGDDYGAMRHVLAR
ncbi:MAG: excinuclease ABC subunit UvrC, partial [Pseudomonadota bacterium]